MGIDVNNSNQYHIGLNPNLKLNNYSRNYYLKNSNMGDSFRNNSPLALYNEHEIKKMVCENPEIIEILKNHRIPLRLNMKEIYELRNGHCQTTQDICVKIAKNIPPDLRQFINIKDLKDAAILHDFGKVLIPAKILNKNSVLTQEEYKIMNLHSELGYQLLKTTGVNQNVQNIVRYHHNIDGNYLPDINLQILNLADKYSALTENRVYRKQYSPAQALKIIHNDVLKGNIDPLLFHALVNAIKNENDAISKSLYKTTNAA